MDRSTTSEGFPSLVEPSVSVVGLGGLTAPRPGAISGAFMQSAVARLGRGGVSCNRNRSA
jgi:hypothetical protein